MSNAPRRLLQSAPAADDLLAQAMHATRVADPTPAQLGELQTRMLVELASATPAARASQPWWLRSRSWIAGGVLLVLVGGYLGLRNRPRAEPARTEQKQEKRAQTLPEPARPQSMVDVQAELVAPKLPPTAARTAKRARVSDTPTAQLEPSTELELLQQAESALRSDASNAYELTQRHLRAYPEGTLAQERELLAIQAQLKLGERAAAELRAQQFRERYPRSPLERRLERVLARDAQIGNASDQPTHTQQEVKP